MNRNLSYTQVVAIRTSFFKKTIGLLKLHEGKLLFVTKTGVEDLGTIENILFKTTDAKIIVKSNNIEREFNYPIGYRNYKKDIQPLFALSPVTNDVDSKNTYDLLKAQISEYTAGQYLDGKVPNKVAAVILKAAGAQPF